MMDNCELHSGRLNNVRGYNLTVTGSDGRHDTVTSEVIVTFDKFSEAAVEQTVILRLETAEPSLVSEVVEKISLLQEAHSSLKDAVSVSAQKPV